ncbi:hypothetical protein [Tenacibaculum sp. C7A-26P2]|uniref:hypothetical protein n=1 Tax=Tenacibaculum sp. C7A-26P2 TaxID=3447504 RepID=UPI003F8389E4
MDLCNCPDVGILGAIPNSNCPWDIKQLQRLILQETPYKWKNGTVDITKKADWDVLIAATDKTKVIVTPNLRDVKIEPGDFITEGGGDNTTLNGVEEITGQNPSTVTALLKSGTPEQEKAIRKITCKSNLGFYGITNEGKILCRKIGDDHFPIDIQPYSFGIKDRRNEGFGTKDSNDIQFALAPRWSEDIVLVSPEDFNPFSLAD